MSYDTEKRDEEMINKLRKLKGFSPMTPEEADAAYHVAPADHISDDEINSMIEFAISGGRASWEPRPDIDWPDEVNTSDIEDDVLQIHRNKGEDDGDTTEEDKLRKELLNDDKTENENGVDGGKELPADGE
jgi:hypothetical protein